MNGRRPAHRQRPRHPSVADPTNADGKIKNSSPSAAAAYRDRAIRPRPSCIALRRGAGRARIAYDHRAPAEVSGIAGQREAVRAAGPSISTGSSLARMLTSGRLHAQLAQAQANLDALRGDEHTSSRAGAAQAVGSSAQARLRNAAGRRSAAGGARAQISSAQLHWRSPS